MPPPTPAAAHTPTQYAQLALSLPPRLLNFLRRHPPGTYSQGTTSGTAQPSLPSEATITHPAIPEATLLSTAEARNASNPFEPWRNPATQRWRPPIYSLRRQAELHKLAAAYGVASLLPQGGLKDPLARTARRQDVGLRVRGTGEGQRVKGKAWERGLRGKLEARERAMEGMGALIKEWKQKGHGRGWKKWPK